MSERLGHLAAALEAAKRELQEVEERRYQLQASIEAMEAAVARDAPDSISPQQRAGRQRRHVGKYRPLFDYLVSKSGSETIRMTFTEIEAILGFSLPPSARRHLPHWYGYEGSAVARAIQDAGWKATRIDLAEETVIFVEQ